MALTERRQSSSFWKAAAAFLVLGIALGSISSLTADYLAGNLASSECNEQYDLLNPRWRCKEFDGTLEEKKEYEEFLDELQAWITQEQDAGRIDHVSVYFRDLEGGPWFGINEKELFSAASLLKVPIMMVFLKHAETMPHLLSQEVVTNGKVTANENIADPRKTVVPGEYYSLDELLYKMIVYSDNASKDLLVARLKSLDDEEHLLEKAYSDLGMIAEDESLSEMISIKSYSSFFRMLYNGFYLNREMSQKALDLLSQSEYREALAAGVPSHLKVAHKFGIRNNDLGQQLHDCGIVYHPKIPYLICVMTRGEDMDENQNAIRAISKQVYEEVDRRSRASAQ